jgi:hypothetical protein
MTNYSVILETIDCKINDKSSEDTHEIHFNYIIDNGEVNCYPLSGIHEKRLCLEH